MATRSLSDWVNYIQTLHVREIDLSLERVAQVYRSLYPKGVSYQVVTIAGTNGKGSTAELASSMLYAAGNLVGKYTSPHLISFNERFNLNGDPIDDTSLLHALEDVEKARADVRLTFFEFGTLVAIHLFELAKVDVAIMEVGLGGRLDAVNILSPSVTVITNISVDHTAWLGNTIEAIATEKFGITRKNVNCIVGTKKPPAILLDLAKKKEVPLLLYGKDFSFAANDLKPNWRYQNNEAFACDEQPILVLNALPLPFGQSGHQLENAAAAITAVKQLRLSKNIEMQHIYDALKVAHNPARSEVISNDPLIMLDVAHNVASVRALAQTVKSLNIKGDVIAVCGMLADKEVEKALSELHQHVSSWHVTSIHSERGASSTEIKAALERVVSSTVPIVEYDTARGAYRSALNLLNKSDCLLVFGSFMVTGDILASIKEQF